MPVKIFQPSQHKEEVKQLLRDGKTVEECATLFPLSERTIYRYYREIQDEIAGKPPPGKRTTPAVTIPGVSKEAFTAQGVQSPPPPGSPVPEYLTIGTFRMPLEDWGYSSALGLLIVAETFTQARVEYNFDKKMKVGDFIAYLCQAFRIMRGWDAIGIGYTPAKIEKEGGA
jgi:hypothetical protein